MPKSQYKPIPFTFELGAGTYFYSISTRDIGRFKDDGTFVKITPTFLENCGANKRTEIQAGGTWSVKSINIRQVTDNNATGTRTVSFSKTGDKPKDDGEALDTNFYRDLSATDGQAMSIKVPIKQMPNNTHSLEHSSGVLRIVTTSDVKFNGTLMQKHVA